VATDDEVDAAVEEAVRAGGVVVKQAAPTPLGGSYAFFADPDGHVWEVIHHPLYRLGTGGRPEIPQHSRGWRRGGSCGSIAAPLLRIHGSVRRACHDVEDL
jgi:Glyoxalase/Bleomycin resistance protein/Dioxygenase superfamily